MTFAISLHHARWRKSSHSSSNGGNCVEVGDGLAGVVPVRDSKDPGGAVLVFDASAWSSFVTAVKGQEFPLCDRLQ